jgi:N utilization substance protein B
MNNYSVENMQQNIPLNEWESKLSQRDKRSLIFHLLYGAESYDYTSSIEAFADNLNRGFDLMISLDGQLVSTANEITAKREELDRLFHPFLENWRPERLSVCTKLILRYAIWELLYTKTNPTIVINEAIELAKAYAEKDAYKLINGVLDQFTKHHHINVDMASIQTTDSEEKEPLEEEIIDQTEQEDN